MRVRLAAGLGVVAALAGCGASEPSVYAVPGTAACLRSAHYQVTTDVSKLGVVAASAPNGSLRATESGNNVTISFGENETEAKNMIRAYRRFAPKRLRRHIDDLIETQKNAVLLWGVHTPPQEELNTVLGCLKG